MKMVIFKSHTAFVLALLFTLLSALTIPLNRPTLFKPSNVTLSDGANKHTNRLGFPPAPFRYKVESYGDSGTVIVFTDYGAALSHDDAVRTLLEAQVIVMREMTRDPRGGDMPVRNPSTPSPLSVLVHLLFYFHYSSFL